MIYAGKMPVLALRGLAVFPEQTVHFDVGRVKSALALEEAMKGDQMLLLIPQKNIVDDDPGYSGLFTIGTVAKVKQVLKAQNDNIRVLVTGLRRAKITEMLQTAPYLSAMVESVPEIQAKDNLQSITIYPKDFESKDQITQILKDYNKMVVDDEQSQLSSYASEFRGRVQNKQTELKCLPMYTLGYYRKEHTTRRYIPYSKALEDYSMHNKESQKLLMCSEEVSLDSARISMHQSRITQDIILGDMSQLVMDYYIVRDFESAMSTLDSIVVSDRNISPFYHFMRAQVRTAQIEAQPINENELRIRYMEILQDLKYCDHNIQDFAYASYNMGNTYVKLKDYQSAINSYSRAIEIDNKLPEAYFNRGITYILMKEINKGLADLSQAGEMGLYQAYNLIKKYSQK